jgi:hypothetical protein
MPGYGRLMDDPMGELVDEPGLGPDDDEDEEDEE